MEENSGKDNRRRPRLIPWLVLSIGMVAMLLFAARDTGLRPEQLATLALSTIVLAGLCVWIIGWE